MKRVKTALLALVLVLALFVVLPFSSVGATEPPNTSEVPDTSEVPEAAETAPSSEPPQTYSINYNANGGVFPAGGAYYAQNNIDEGSWVTVITDVPYAQGNNFAGWYSSLDGKIYWGGQGFELTGHTTLWATWVTIPMYSITLHFNTDDGFQSTGRYQEGHEFDLTPYTTNRDGYEFKGWSTDPAATQAEILPGSRIALWGETNVYAIWEAMPEEPPSSSLSESPSSSLPQSSSVPQDSSTPARDENTQATGSSAVWKWLFILLVAAGAIAAIGALVAGRRKRKP